MATMELLDEVKGQVDFWFDLAEEMYHRSFQRPIVNLNLRGTTAGMALRRSFEWEIRYNKQLFEENKDKFSKRTVPHEVAHVVANQLAGGRIKPHGPWWKNVMRSFGCEESRCHSYDVSNVKQKRSSVARQYSYSCNCRTMMFTSIRHKRSQEYGGGFYRCNHCGTSMKYNG